jgi:hypothetical protein
MSEASTDSLREQIALLDDIAAPADAKQAASDALVAAGKAAIPVLIGRLENPEDHLYLDGVRVPTGPMNAGPPATMPVQVRFQVESLLYRIVRPPAEKPAASVRAGARAASGGVPTIDHERLGVETTRATPELRLVDDWPAWWRAHRDESLEQIREWFRDEAERRWSRIHEKTTAPPP